MNVTTVRERLHRAFDFPVDHETVVDGFGHVELEPPSGEPETIGTVLSRTDEPSYRSAAAVATAIYGSLPAAYVGREGYDDRAGVRALPEDRNPESV